MFRGVALALVAALVCGWPASATCADEQSVAGSWSGSIATQQGDAGDVELVLKQDGEVVTGTVSNSRTGLVKSPLFGTLKGNRLTFRVPATGAQWEATVAGTTMEGTARRPGKLPGSFTAIKNE
jgi:hypothetical protein